MPPKTEKATTSKTKPAKPAAKKASGSKTNPSAARSTPRRATADTGKAKPRKSGGRSRKPTLAQAALQEVKEVATDVLIGAAAGAVRGAAEAAVGHAEEGVEKIEQVADTAESMGEKTAPKARASKSRSKA